MDSLQILNDLGKVDSPILHMGEISKDMDIRFQNCQTQTDFDNDVKKGMNRGSYRQL